MKNQTITGSLSTANQSKKGLILLASFSFIVLTCLLAASNRALAMDMATFRAKYRHIEGYEELTTAGVNNELNRIEIKGGTYVFKPTRDEKTNLFMPAIVYKNDFGQIETIKLDPALTMDQVENEIMRLKSTKVLAQPLREKKPFRLGMLMLEKIKNDIIDLDDEWKGKVYYQRLPGHKLDHSDPRQVAGVIQLGERANKVLEEVELDWGNKTLRSSLNDAITKYKNNPSESTYDGLADAIAKALTALNNYYHPRE